MVVDFRESAGEELDPFIPIFCLNQDYGLFLPTEKEEKEKNKKRNLLVFGGVGILFGYIAFSNPSEAMAVVRGIRGSKSVLEQPGSSSNGVTIYSSPKKTLKDHIIDKSVGLAFNVATVAISGYFQTSNLEKSAFKVDEAKLLFLQERNQLYLSFLVDGVKILLPTALIFKHSELILTTGSNILKFSSEKLLAIRGGAFIPLPGSGFLFDRVLNLSRFLINKVSKRLPTGRKDDVVYDDFLDKLWKETASRDVSTDSPTRTFIRKEDKETFLQVLLALLQGLPTGAIFLLDFLATSVSIKENRKKLYILEKSIMEVLLFTEKEKEEAFYSRLYKNLKKNLWIFVSSLLGIFLIVFLVMNRRMLYRLVTQSSERDKLIVLVVDTLKDNFHQFQHMVDDNVKNVKAWANEFYGGRKVYRAQDTSELVAKNRQIKKSSGKTLKGGKGRKGLRLGRNRGRG